MGKTTIEWASHTWNPYTWNCHKVSPGCKHCYAESLANRYGKVFSGAPEWRGKNAMRELKGFPSGAVVFVNSMSDTYHEQATLEMIHGVHNAALLRPDVTFLLLSKRPERAYALSPYLVYPRNLWVGTSVESEDYLWRLDYLLRIPATGHFVSAEPLLGSIAGIERYMRPTADAFERFAGLKTYPACAYPNSVKWVIVGGESGGNRRVFDLDWARELQRLCSFNGVPFMFKQGSAFKSGQDRLLDGRTWDETPDFKAVLA